MEDLEEVRVEPQHLLFVLRLTHHQAVHRPITNGKDNVHRNPLADLHINTDALMLPIRGYSRPTKVRSRVWQ
eukprot:34446-Eustigmatos_ZCMA.PRE.1